MIRSLHFGVCCLVLCPALSLANEAVTKVTVAQPLERESADYDFQAQVEASPQIAVRAQIEGTVDKVLCKVGQEVKRGDTLLMIAAMELAKRRSALAADVAKAQGALQLAEKKLQVATKDPRRQIDLPTLTAQRDLAAVSLKVAQKELAQLEKDATHSAVTAPIDGVVIKLPVAPGEQVSSGASFATLLCTIAQTNPVFVTFQLEERTLLYLRKVARDDGEEAKKNESSQCPVRLKLASDDAFQHQGLAQCSDSRLDPKTGKVRFLAEFTNNDKLTAIALTSDPSKRAATIRLSIGKPRKALLVPSAAIGFNANDEPQVLVIDKKNLAQPKLVKLGPAIGGFQAVTEGLQGDDWVIVGAERPTLDSPDQVLSPADFATDIRALRVRPGTVVDPERIKLSLPEASPSSLPRTKDSSPK